jgi:hypothetical protein
LANLNDVSWNSGRLAAVLGTVNGLTVAHALLHQHKQLKYPEFLFCRSIDLLFILPFSR